MGRLACHGSTFSGVGASDQSVFPAPSYPGDEGAEVRAGDIMANADVGLAHSEKHSIGDGTAKRRLGRAAQCGLTDATQARK